jgi:hypothetical protein
MKLAKSIIFPSVAVLACFFLSIPALAGPKSQDPVPEKRVYTAKPVNPHPPAVDGKLDDPVWEKAEWQGDFIQREPYDGAKPSEATAFKILYDDKAIYVAIKAFDRDCAKIERRISRRDDIEGDSVDITLDSYHDLRTGFNFSVNAAGVKSDRMLTNDELNDWEPDMSWDPIWEVATSGDGECWTAEMRIPFSQLRFGNAEEQVWGLQVTRKLFRQDERSAWQHIPKGSPGWVHMFGELRGILGIRPPRQVEIMPYTVGRHESFRRIETNPFATGRKSALLGGLDGKIGVTHDLTLNFTVNPDFGQVEADPSVVNLTAFETYYQEKRPFFVEGRNILNFNLMNGDGDNSSDNLFYSRRIGRSPQYYPDIDGEVRTPEATTILGAFKLTGKTRSGLSVGILESVTARETASTYSLGQYGNEAVEPLTNYFGLRLQKDYNQGATIVGGMLTAVNRGLKDESLKFLHDSAYTGGFDFYHAWNKKTYFFSLKTVFSAVHGSPEAIQETQLSSLRYYQRPDAKHVEYDPLRTSLFGHGGTIQAGKQGGGHFQYVAGVNWRSPGLELNDMGYLRQADDIMEFVWAGYNIWKPFSIFRELSLNVNQWAGWNFGGVHTYTGGNINMNGQFKNYWSGGLGINRNFRALSQSALRGGPLLAVPGALNIWTYLETDQRKKVRFMFQTSTYDRDNGDQRQRTFQVGVIINPNKALNVSVAPTYSSNRQELQYIATEEFGGDPRYLFGRVDQKTLGVTVRLNYSLSPELSIQLYGQPFVASGRYSRYKRITDPRTRDYANRYSIFAANRIGYDAESETFSVDENGDGLVDYGFDNPNFNVLEFRSNLVVRWEYVPGSALYLVWSQGRDGFRSIGDFSFGRDLSDLFDVHPRNVFLIKFSYCFQL